MLIISAVFLLIGGGMLFGSLFFLLRKKKFLKSAVGVPGVITNVDLRHGMSRDNHGFREKWYYPTVRFQTKSGEIVERTMAGSRSNNQRVGKKVQVNYDEQNPDRVTLGNPQSWTIYIPNLIPMVVGGVFGLVGFGLFVGGLLSGGESQWHYTDQPSTSRPGSSRTPYNNRNRRRY